MGIDGRIWGPHLWIFVSHIIMKYPIKPSNLDIVIMKSFFESIANTLPCEICQEHFQHAIISGVKDIKLPPLDFSVLNSRDKLFKWWYDFHDYVNKNKVIEDNEKRTVSPDYEKVYKMYSEYIDKDFWQPHFWYYVSIVIINYECKQTTDVMKLKNFLEYMAKETPKYNFHKYIVETLKYDTIKSREKLFKWFYDFRIKHDTEYSLSYDSTKKYYNKMLSDISMSI